MDNDTRKEYELAYLVKDENLTGAAAEIVKAQGGEVRLEGNASRIRLAYPINKQTEAYFGYVQFLAEPAVAKTLEAALNLDQRILRSLLMTPPPLKEKKRMGEGPRPVEPRVGRPSESRSLPLSNEALEKKIEEILQ